MSLLTNYKKETKKKNRRTANEIEKTFTVEAHLEF